MSIVAGGAVILIIIVVYYLFEYRPDQHIKKLSKIHDLNELELIEDSNPASFEHYNDRYTKGLFTGMIPFFIIVIIAARIGGIAIPIGLIGGGSMMIAIFIGTNYMIKMQEIESAGKGPSSPMLCYFPKHGPKNITLKAMELKKHIELDDDQKDTLAKKTREIIAGMKNMETMQFTDATLTVEKQKELLLDKIETWARKRLDEAQVYRFISDGKYKIVLITSNKIQDMILPDKLNTLFKSYHIDTDIMAMWSIFIGKTRELFETTGKSGRTEWISKQAGVILDIFDWADFWRYITSGEFIVASKQTALMGQLVNLEEQKTTTSTELNKAQADRIGALDEVEDKNNKDLLKNLGNIAADLTKQFAEANKPRSERANTDYVLAIFIMISMLLIGVIAGINSVGGLR
jgi:ribosomal protein L15